MSGLDCSAMPVTQDHYGHWDLSGLTKREHACIALRVPKTGDAELDALIRTAQRRDVAAMAMQGILASGAYGHFALSDNSANWAVKHADALLAALSARPDPKESSNVE